MALFFDVKVTTTDGGVKPVAGMAITQVDQREGTTLRTYRVDSWRRDMRTEAKVESSAFVVLHDRERPVWDLIAKAIASII